MCTNKVVKRAKNQLKLLQIVPKLAPNMAIATTIGVPHRRGSIGSSGDAGFNTMRLGECKLLTTYMGTQ